MYSYNIIQLLLTASYLLVSLYIHKKLREHYLSEDGIKSGGAVFVYPVAIIVPSRYFKKEVFWKGYLLYLLSFVLVIMAALTLASIGGRS